MHEGHSDYSPSITARIWTVSDHQWSKALKLQNGFTLRMRNCVSSSWFERLRISDRNFVNHTTEVILWSMILKMALWAVELTQGQPKQLVSVDFCSAALERDWALIVGTFHFRLGAPWLKKPSRLLLHKLHASGFRSDNHRWKNQMPTPSVSCTLDFQIKHVRAFLVYSCQHMIFTSMKRWALLGLSKADCWFQRNRQKLTWRTIFHILQSGYWYSVFN